ncbi:superinfection immunity protein [Gemmatimonas phototrophica]|nr:superinfection immunity protein [Gemmatimonas phototrophica]
MLQTLLLLRALQEIEPPRGYTGGGVPKGGVMIIALILLYFLPTMLAHAGGKRRKLKITAINVLLGWTVIGWIASMLMVWAYEAPLEDEETLTP